MKNILVLGAGLVAQPGVEYLLKQSDLHVTVAEQYRDKAENLINNYKNGTAVELDVNNEIELSKLISQNEIIISLLPWTFHVHIAKLCLNYNKHLVTASYVSDEMKELNEKAKSKGLLFLNEIGLDPGIDHMSAMQIIDKVHFDGGQIEHFKSFCGGLPSPQHNDNPFGYKFSWSPKGVLLASKNPARYLKNGNIIEIDGKDLFLNYNISSVKGLGKFEIYPNRDSVPYQNIYNIQEALTVLRGTYRNLGWCDTFKAIVDLDLVSDTIITELVGMTNSNIMRKLISNYDCNVKDNVAKFLNINTNCNVINRLEWLGLFSDKITSNNNNYLDFLSELLQAKLSYLDGEIDMVILQHEFIVINKDGSRDKLTSTLIDYGIENGASSMARTVSLPLAIAVKLIADKKITLTGVHIPIKKEIYEPVLLELKSQNIILTETITAI